MTRTKYQWRRILAMNRWRENYNQEVHPEPPYSGDVTPNKVAIFDAGYDAGYRMANAKRRKK